MLIPKKIPVLLTNPPYVFSYYCGYFRPIDIIKELPWTKKTPYPR